MVNNLRTYGAKTSAKASSIQSQVVSAIKNFDHLRQQKYLDSQKNNIGRFHDMNSEVSSEVSSISPITGIQSLKVLNTASAQNDENDQEETVIEVPPASYRLIMVTVCFSQKVTSN